ncbi:putative membrane protein [Enterococcus sp. PF1-24]|uniref:ECF transporter S component n=1 Tax=unclassified Enterococcus TaxID=2608891 RepID=UPI002474D80A|nr:MULTISPECIES: ECF transporter S component [unclassified Enterococcus]MDH6363292.1 putative membrane protein [Enterococcus sp. PFB1-1]MDH6400407.1 putative membrane protein [Enterococcus sp. PF1-24]
MKNTRTYTLTALFLALLILLATTPLGYINLGVINATTMHIPVIVASIVLGPKIGGFLGGVFGLTSMIRNTVMPVPLSFAFSPFIPVYGTDTGSWKALIVTLVPRILIGVVPYFVYKCLNKLLKEKQKSISLFIAGILGSMTNTLLVMNLIYFLFKEPYAEMNGKAGAALYYFVIGIIFGNGIPEAIVAGITASAICMVLFRIIKTDQNYNL